MTLEFLTDAQAEFYEAAVYYEDREVGLGKRFRAEVWDICSAISEHPLIWRERERGFRRVHPYAVRMKMSLHKLMETVSEFIRFSPNMGSSLFLLPTIAIGISGWLQAGEPVKIEMLIMAIGDPGGGKLQSNSTGCAVVHFRNRTTERVTFPTAPRELFKGRVEDWDGASYISPTQGKDGYGWGYRAAYDVPKIVVEFLGGDGKVVHRDRSIQMAAIEELDPEGTDSAPIIFSTPAKPGVYAFRFAFDNTMMAQPNGSNGGSGIAANLKTANYQIVIPAVPVMPAKAEPADGQPATKSAGKSAGKSARENPSPPSDAP